MTRLKEVLICALLGILIFAIGNGWWNARLLMQQGQQAAQNVKNSTARADQYIDAQLDLIQSEQYQKSIKAGLETGAVYNATGRLINTQVIPRAMKDLDRLDGLLAALTVNSQTLSTFITNTDRSVNQSLLPQATDLLAALTKDADRFGVSLDTFNKMLVLVSEKASMTLDEVLALVSSPEWELALQGLNLTMANVASATGKADASIEQIRLALLKAPSIAESLEKIAKTSSRFAKATILANIISVLARAFLP